MILPVFTVVSSNWGPIAGPPLTYVVSQLLCGSFEVPHVSLKFHSELKTQFRVKLTILHPSCHPHP
jgi:hypothetical protein